MNLKLRAMAGCWALMAAWPAHALLESCTATAQATAFGNYSPLSGTPVDTTGQVTVTCTAVVSISVNYTISLSQGGAASFSPRKMSYLANSLNYNLYTTSGYGTIWGDGSGGTSTVSDGYALGLLLVVRNYTVYGRIPASQNVPAGAYSDLITVTVNY
jgi:spore coat protein U-like protein